MPAESNLDVLLRGLEPRLHAAEYVFCTLDAARLATVADIAIATFREPEGVTAILPREDAEHLALAFSFPCRMITLTIHSSLEAVGLLARVTAQLAQHGISVNAVSAFYHDHLFVPAERADEAVALLQGLQRSSGKME